jgi:gamma-glutamylcyclotransferase (GGCT)/AIG2-like uncharacterized protein YtfP
MTSETSRATEKLFVYGSLKADFPLHPIIEGHEYLGTYKTRPQFKLVSFGPFPALVPARDGRDVSGEVYLVDEEILHYLDVVEGVDRGLYSRFAIPVHDQLGDEITAWAYVSLLAQRYKLEVVESGVWDLTRCGRVVE